MYMYMYICIFSEPETVHDESRIFESSSRKVSVLPCYLCLVGKATPTPPIALCHTPVLHLESQISSQNKVLFQVFSFIFLQNT